MTHHHRMAWSLQLSWTILILKLGRVVWWCKTWRNKIKAQLLTSLSFPLWQSPGPDIVRMAPHPPAVDTLAPPPQATGGRRLSILIFDPSEHHRPEFKVQDDSPGKLCSQWHLADEITTIVPLLCTCFNFLSLDWHKIWKPGNIWHGVCNWKTYWYC